MRVRRVGVVVAICALTLTACGTAATTFKRQDLPKVEPATGKSRRGPTPIGNIAYQPPLVPITISLDTNGDFKIEAEARIATPLGAVKISSGVAKKLVDGRRLPARPADVTLLIVCREGTARQRCEAFQIGSGRKLRVEMDGQFVSEVERNRIVIDVASGSTITVTDGGAPAKHLQARGPARRAIERVTFQEFGPDTELDLERSQSGTTNDLSYDHITGELKPINGAQVAKIKKSGSFFSRLSEEDLPSEHECQLATDWKDNSFGKDDFQGPLIACIKTAEADLGYLVIWPLTEKEPVTLEFYSFVWVR